MTTTTRAKRTTTKGLHDYRGFQLRRTKGGYEILEPQGFGAFTRIYETVKGFEAAKARIDEMADARVRKLIKEHIDTKDVLNAINTRLVKQDNVVLKELRELVPTTLKAANDAKKKYGV